MHQLQELTDHLLPNMSHSLMGPTDEHKSINSILNTKKPNGNGGMPMFFI